MIYPCANANDVAATVVAGESTRWWMKERENKTIVDYLRTLSAIACGMAPAAPALGFLDIFLMGGPTKHPAALKRFRDAFEHDGRTPASQLKPDLLFRIRISMCPLDASRHVASM